MSRKTTVNLIVFSMSVSMIDEDSLVDIFNRNGDFTENKELFRINTLALGFRNESARVSKEIYTKVGLANPKLLEEDESEFVNLLVKEALLTEGFIGRGVPYGEYTYNITETDFEYIIAIAYTT